jgi:uncharacterized protein (TIGR03000 family)
MRSFAVLLLAGTLGSVASAQFPAIPSAPAVQPTIQPLPFMPYVPPVHCIGKVGRDFINCVIPDWRVLAGASFFNTEFERVYNRLYSQVRHEARVAQRLTVTTPTPAIDPHRAILMVQVDPRAEVFVENHPLKQPGLVREFLSPPLKPGNYEYSLVVRWFDGSTTHQTRLTVPVRPGEKSIVVALTPGLGPTP